MQSRNAPASIDLFLYSAGTQNVNSHSFNIVSSPRDLLLLRLLMTSFLSSPDTYGNKHLAVISRFCWIAVLVTDVSLFQFLGNSSKKWVFRDIKSYIGCWSISNIQRHPNCSSKSLGTLLITMKLIVVQPRFIYANIITKTNP